MLLEALRVSRIRETGSQTLLFAFMQHSMPETGRPVYTLPEGSKLKRYLQPRTRRAGSESTAEQKENRLSDDFRLEFVWSQYHDRKKERWTTVKHRRRS
jgi:hypothetical protein